MCNTNQTLREYRLLSYVNDGFGLESRSVYLFRSGMIIQLLRAWAQNKKIDLLIDIGCSTGHITKAMSDLVREIHAVDANASSLEKIQVNNVKTIQDTLPRLAKLVPNTADAVMSFGTLYYLDKEDLKIAAARICELLKPGGYFIFNDDDGNVTEFEHLLSHCFCKESVLSAPVSIRQKFLPDKMFWAIEHRFLFYRAIFRALEDPDFDSEVELSPFKNGRVVQICLKHRWLKYCLWTAYPLRVMAKLIWANPILLRLFWIKKQPLQYLWVYRKFSD